MKIEKSFVANVALGMFFGGIALFTLFKWVSMDITTYRWAVNLQAKIDAQQKAISQAQPAPATK